MKSSFQAETSRMNFKNSFFFSLTPTEDAKKIETYRDAMDFAFTQKDIRNIAVTGPYGAGKSSFLKTHFKNSSDSILWISLAQFLGEAEKNEGQVPSEGSSREEMERRGSKKTGGYHVLM